MKRLMLLFLFILAVSAQPALAVSFFDDFEGGVSGSVWTKWTGGSQELLQTSNSHNFTPAGSQSALAVQADPTAFNAYADFGSTAGFVRAQVYVFEDFSNDGTNGSQPITNMLALVGDTGTSTPGFSTDYLQLGVVNFLPGGNTGYSTRSRANGADVSADTGVDRSAGWIKLAIEADALADGGQVRYFIDDVQVGASVRSNTNLRWIRLGNNSKSYENFWYDDVSVVPEPSSMLTLGVGSLALLFFRRRRGAQQ